MNMYLQAVALGLMAHPMAGFDDKKLREKFNIPDQFTVISIIAIGYQAEAEVLEDEKQRISELAERKRQLLNSCFFDSEWGKGI
jgi:nitroreductase